MPHDDRVDDAEFLEAELILLQDTEAFVRCHGDIAGTRRQAAVEDLHEGGLAAAIGADETVAIAIAEFDGDIFE